MPEAALTDAAGNVIAGAPPGSPEWQRLDALLARWQARSDARPVYAGFLEYFARCFGATPAADAPDWADELRDALGLYHLTAGTGILVFRYPLQELPKPPGQPTLRAVAAPCVLDGSQSEAFCPAPAGLNCGHTVDLRARGNARPAGEVVHPWIRLEPRHVFRVGVIRRPVPARLDDARGLHLLALRDLAQRPNYAQATDADLLGAGAA